MNAYLDILGDALLIATFQPRSVQRQGQFPRFGEVASEQLDRAALRHARVDLSRGEGWSRHR